MKNGDRLRVDLKACRVDALVDDAEWAARAKALEESGGYPKPESQSPWQQYFRELVQPFSEGMVLKGATDYQDIAHKYVPRDNH